HQVHRHHGVEVLDLHLGEALVAQDTGVRDQDVDAAPLAHHLVDHVRNARVIRDASAVGDRFTTGRRDLLHHCFGGGAVAARAVDRTAEVVDHDLRAAMGELERMRTAQTAAGPGDDGNL